MRAEPAALVPVLTEARQLGFLGPGPVERQLAHARAFVEVVSDVLGERLPELTGPGVVSGTPSRMHLVDLGSGGGVPGLVLACGLPTISVTLLEANARRAAFLDRACQVLDLRQRVTVLHDRAERLGRMPTHRSAYAVVTARSFGPPTVTAECAAPLLQVGGKLVVAEPPTSAELAEPVEAADEGGRWPVAALAELGMGAAVPRLQTFHFVVIRQLAPCGERYPRRTGIPAKRPLS